MASKCAARAVTLCSTIQQTPNRTVTRASQACTGTLPRTPAVNTAALPLSNISSSSSSVVAFPAEARRRGAQRQNSWGEHHGRPSRSFYLAEQRAGLSLTDLELSLDASFTPLPEVHLGLVVFGHHLHELPGQHRMLCGQKEEKERFKETARRRQRFDNGSNNDVMAICEEQDLKSPLSVEGYN